MESNQSNNNYHLFSFNGDGMELFKIQIVNWLLTIVTLGFYYPWAKAATLKYNYPKTIFSGSPFAFHGTGKEMFKGFLKLVGFVILFYAIAGGLSLLGSPILMAIGMIVLYAIILLAIPFAVHGSLRYRTSRSSWRGIHFGYRGERTALSTLFIKGVLLTIVTLGIYGAWFVTDLRRYILKNIRFGNITFEYTGRGSEFLWIHVVGYFLSLITFGIYLPWYIINLYNYYLENIKVTQDGKTLTLQNNMSGGGLWGLLIVNVLLIIVTLGLAAPWVQVRTLRYIAQHIWIEGEFNANTLEQTEEAYKDATGEDLADYLDINLI